MWHNMCHSIVMIMMIMMLMMVMVMVIVIIIAIVIIIYCINIFIDSWMNNVLAAVLII